MLNIILYVHEKLKMISHGSKATKFRVLNKYMKTIIKN